MAAHGLHLPHLCSQLGGLEPILLIIPSSLPPICLFKINKYVTYIYKRIEASNSHIPVVAPTDCCDLQEKEFFFQQKTHWMMVAERTVVEVKRREEEKEDGNI